MLQSTGDNDMFGDNDVRINVNSINPRNFNTNSYNINSNIGYNNNNNPSYSNSNSNSNRNNSINSNANQNMPILNAPTDYGARSGSGMYGGVGADSVGGFYSTAGGGGGGDGGIGGAGSQIETDNKSIVSTPSRISKFTYSGL